MLFNKLGFQKKLTLGFSGISWICLTGCGVFSYYFTSQIVRNLAIGGLADQIQGIQSAIEVAYADNTDRQKQQMDYWSGQIIPRFSWSNKEQLLFEGAPATRSGLVNKISRETGSIVTLFTKTDQGFTRIATSLTNVSGQPPMESALSSNSQATQALLDKKPYTDRENIQGDWYMASYEPIVLNGQVRGAFFMARKNTSEKLIKEYLRHRKILETGYFYILDSSGTVLLHPSKEGQNLLAGTDVDGIPIFREIIERKNGTLIYRWLNAETHKVQNKLALFSYFPKIDWYVAASLNLSEALEPLEKLRWVLILITFTMTLGMVVVTFVFGKQVSTALIQVVVSLRRPASQVEGSSRRLSDESNLLATSSIHQASSLQETVSAVEEIRATAAKNLDGTQLTERLSNEMAMKAESGQQVLAELTKKVQRIATSNDALRSEIHKSHQDLTRIVTVIKAIDAKTNIINEIVFQTKLLSFNASVEAARAGEQGKGFSVVAEEVGRLASLSGNAANEIKKTLIASVAEVSEIVQRTQSQSESLIQSTEQEIREGVQISSQCRESFERILTQVTETNQAIADIANASKEQTMGVEEINKAILLMDQVTQTNSGTAQQVNVLADELRSSAVAMSEAISLLETFVSGKSL